MGKINYIVIKKYKNKRAEMYVFTDDGKETVYEVSRDGKEILPSSHEPLKRLAEQEGISYSAEGLRKLKDSKLLHYMDEEEFDQLHDTIKHGNENQAHYQNEKEERQEELGEEKTPLEEKWFSDLLSNLKENPNLLFENSGNSYFDSKVDEKQISTIYRTISDYMLSPEEPKINFIVIKKYENKTAEMHVFMNNGKEAIYPVSNDGKEILQSSHAYLKKLAEQEGISYSAEGLKKLKEKRLLHYMDEELFDDLYSIIEQENKDQIRHQEEKKAAQIAQFLKEHGLKSEADLDLDDSKVGVYVDCAEFLPTDSLEEEDSIGESLKRKGKVTEILEGFLNSEKGKNVGITMGAIIAAAVMVAIVKAHTQAGKIDLGDAVSIANDATRKDLNNERTSSNKKKTKKVSEPTSTNSSDVEQASQYSAPIVEEVEVKKYQNITDALNNADINNKKKEHLSKVYSWLKFFNGTFANRYYSKKDDTKPAHRWNEAVLDYLLFNNIDHTTVYNILDNSSLDTDQLMKSFKRGIDQDTQAYIISEESLKVDQLINSENGKEFYKMYKVLFKKYKSLTEDSKYTKEEVANTFSKLVRKDFLIAEDKMPAYKLAVLPIINAFYELSSDIDIVEKLSQEELEAVNKKVMEKAEARLGEYSNALVVNKMLYGDTLEDELSYEKLKGLALEELKEEDNYKVEQEERDITNQKAYQRIIKTLNSDEASAPIDYDSYYKSMAEVREDYKSSVEASKKEASKLKIKRY